MSSLPYIQQLTKVIVAQITQTIGWNSIQTTPLELLTDILHKYLEELTRQTQRYTELYGRTEPNLDDIALAFNDLNINVADLEEYITNVDSVPCIVNVPKFPIPKESNLNFLKPGSKEVVTRPVHIHEHLPPIQPHEETPPAEEPPAVQPNVEDEHNSANIIQTYISTNQISERMTLDENGVFEHVTVADEGVEAINVIGETAIVENHTSAPSDENTFRRPFDVPPSQLVSSHRLSAPSSASNNNENVPNANTIGIPTREIVSCFMTTGGFISPAREGKLPEAKKPIIIEEEPEPVIETRQRTPTPEPIERKHHSNKRESKNDNSDTSKNYGNDAQNANEGAYGDEEKGKEVKLYEVIQTVPEPLPKKKTKKSQLDGAATLKEQKKKKKLNQLKTAKGGSGGSGIKNPFSHIVLTGGGPMDRDRMNEPVDLNLLMAANEKAKKKKDKLEALKKKRKQKQLAANKMPFATSNDTLAVVPEKQRKKKMSKLSKKNLQAMGLNPNAIEGFAIPSTPTDPFALPDTVGEKESMKKIKQRQKLSNSPDKQKIKFFKKLSSTSSNLMSKPNEDPHELDRMMNPMLQHSMTAPNDPNHHMAGHGFNPADSYDGAAQFGHMPGMADLNRTPLNLDDNMAPSKKSKLLKKLNKPPKEPKPPKIKKEKKDPLAKKERAPRTPKFMDQQIGMPKQPLNPDQNLITKMFLNDEFRPNPMNSNVGMIDQFAVPGLNPLNPLFQSVRFDFPARDQNYPFVPGLPNFDFANLSRFKRPNFNDPTQNEMENMAKHPHDMVNVPPKPFCNVAPLMPPSLLNMGSHHKDEYMSNSSINEPHSSQKHYPDNAPNTSFGSKKTVMFNNPNPTFAEQPYAVEKPYDSPIVINSDDDDKRRNPSQSPSLDQDPSFSSGEMKRKKVKDKKDKEKKEKKDKETGVVKLKKKKDKKDKSKNKGEHTKSPKDKSALKKEKREKKKERERSAAALSLDTSDGIGTPSSSYYSSQAHSEWQRDAFSKEPDHSQIGDSSDINATFNTDNSNMETSTVPKLTLKLPPSSSSPSSRTSRPSTPDFPINKKSSKKKKRQWRTMDGDSDKSDADEGVGSSGKVDDTGEQMAREPSPELARISALITRPPKQKSSKQQQAADFGTPIRNDYFDASASIRSDYHSSIASSTPQPATPSGRGRPKGSSSLKGSKSKSKASGSFAADSDKKSQTFDNQSIIDPQSVQNVIQTVNEQTNEDNQVWICPACGLVDDGTPMIGCDGCDDWYHWVCVGILVPPSDDQDWFCRVCISRKQEDKKKKRKKKDKKDH